MTDASGVREYLQQFMDERRIPGMQAAVVRNGKIVLLEALVVANLEHRVPVTHETVFSINSITKAFTGVALMQLVERGKLDLGAPISRYVEGLPGTWQPITIRQLAALISGLPEIMLGEGQPMSVGLIGRGDAEKAWAAVYEMPLEFQPGEGYRYVQTNFALLGKVIDRLSGESFMRFIEKNQLEVAGMAHTRFADDRDLITNRANTYECIGAGNPIYNSYLNWPPMLRTAAGLHSTAQDLAKWIVALQSGALLNEPSSLETLWTPVARSDGKPGLWGIAWPIVAGARGRVCAPAGALKAQIAVYADSLTVILVSNLIGAMPEQLQAMSGNMDLGFMDKVAQFF